MKEKTKKTVLNIIILMAISFAFVSFFAPISCLDYSDVLEQNGYENPDLYWKTETSMLLSHFSEYDCRNSEKPQEFHRYILFKFLKFETGISTGEFTSISDYDISSENDKNLQLSNSLINMARILISFFFFVLFIYFSYKIIKNIENKPDKYILYNAILFIIIFVYVIISGIYINYLKDVNNLGYMDAWYVGYGFYLIIGSIVLFFMAYFLTRYSLDYKEKT